MPDLSSNRFWLKLDNAAKLYPAIQNSKLTAVFRITAQLTERVKIKPFLKAVKLAEERFPYFKMRLKTGFFWYYLEHSQQPVTVIPDFDVPCRAFGKNDLLLRILVKENRVHVEFSHILTDGSGAFYFLQNLLVIYFEILQVEGVSSKLFIGLLNDEEFEDAYNRYFKRVNIPPTKLPKAFKLPLAKRTDFNVLTAIVPIDSLSTISKSYGVSITHYLVAVHLHALQEIYFQQSSHKKNKLLRIQVPIDLRRLFPSKTMRNFSLFVLPGIDMRLGHHSFQEIIKMVYHQMQLETDEKLIHKTMSRNVGGEKNAFVRGMPLFLKSWMLSRLYSVGTDQFSGVLSNYGMANLPKEVEPYIQRFYFIPPPPNRHIRVSSGMIGFKKEVVISFGSITSSKELERRFFSFLLKEGIPVKILNS